MVDGMFPGHLQQVRRAIEIDVNVESGLADRRSDPGLGCQMDHSIDAAGPGDLLEQLSITNIALDQLESVAGQAGFDVGVLESRVVIIGEGVEAEHLVTTFE